MISVIITSYNYAKYIERSIRSCLEQNIARNYLEVIVVNDASTDNTEQVLKNFQNDCRIYNLEENLGLAGARNFGIRKAKGQFIVFIDADDYIHREMLRTQALFLNTNTSLDAVSVDYYLVDARGNHIKHVDASKEPIACGIMFRKDYLYDIGMYDESFRAREEEDLRIRFMRKFNIYNLVVPLYRYRMHGENLTKDKNVMDEYAQKLKQKHNDENE